MNTPAPKPQFLLLLRQPAGAPPASGDLQKIMEQFQTWMDGLQAKNMMLGHNGLVPMSGKVFRGPDGLNVTDGPYAETNEIIGGYVLLTADNLEQAMDAARACPGLNYKMAVELRPVIQCNG